MPRTLPSPTIPRFGASTGRPLRPWPPPPANCSKLNRTTPMFDAPIKVPIIMPQLGESIAEATLVRLVLNPGDAVEADADVLEVETNKAVMGVTATCNGTIAEITAEVDKSYPVGSVLGYIEITAAEAKRLGISDEPGEKKREPQRA